MAKFFDEITDKIREFILEQKIFFVASAAADGRVNLSPKGMDTVRVLDSRTVAYLDLTGSGNETAAHVRASGRLTMMFCGFGEKPLILRLYGQGRTIPVRHPDAAEWLVHFDSQPGQRQVVILSVESVQTSCGMAVPFYEFVGERHGLVDWAAGKGADGIADYWSQKNQVSIDGLPTGLLEG